MARRLSWTLLLCAATAALGHGMARGQDARGVTETRGVETQDDETRDDETQDERRRQTQGDETQDDETQDDETQDERRRQTQGDEPRDALRHDDERPRDEPGTDEPGTEQPGTEQPGTDQPSTDEPGTEQPGTEQPGTDEPGTDEPGTDEPGTDEAAIGRPATAAEGDGEARRDADRAKVAVVLAGDPDPRMRELARSVDRAVAAELRRPFDPGLRAALRGAPGQADDGLEGVRRQRQRLGLSERQDAPVLSTLGRRAAADAIAVIRTGTDGPELVVLDVRHRAFFEGTLPLSASTSPERILQFVRARAAVSARGAAAAPGAAGAQSSPLRVDPAATADDPAGAGADAEEGQTDPVLAFFEEYWPYMAAAVLLGGMIAAIAATSATDGADQPVLRFVPGGR